MRAQNSRRAPSLSCLTGPCSRRLAALLLAFTLGHVPLARALPSLPAVVDRHGPAVVRIVDDAGASLGQGFFVATDGTLLAMVQGAHVGMRVHLETPMAGRVVGRVVVVEGALVVIHAAWRTGDPPPVSLPLAPADAKPPEWVVGVSVDDTGTRVAALGGPRRGQRVPTYDLPSPPGAVVLTTSGEVVGIVLEMRGKSRIVAASSAQMRALVERAGPRHP